MSFFGVTIEKISSIIPHSNADRLEICKLEGMDFQFVIGKGCYSVGQSVLYFPIDSIFPFELMELLDLTYEKEVDGKSIVEGRLAGKDKNRLKTIKLRGEISQGLISSLNILDSIPYRDQSIHEFASGRHIYDPEILTEYLMIEKYDTQSIDTNVEYNKMIKKGNIFKRIFNKYYYLLYNKNVRMDRLDYLSHYDIESADRYKKVANELMNTYVYVTEKIEGSNLSLTYDISQNTFYVNTRNRTLNNYFSKHLWGEQHNIKDRILLFMSKIKLLKPLKDNNISKFYNLFYKKDMYNILELIKDKEQPNQHITIYGEHVGPGIQGNIYQLNQDDFYAFDIKIDDHFVDVSKFLMLTKNRIKRVPELTNTLETPQTLMKWLDGQSLQEASNGKSRINNSVLREGIVIKPLLEYSSNSIGRVLIKQRSPEYLFKTDN